MTPTPLSDYIREERSRAEMQFRRRLRHVLLIIGLLIVAYLLIGLIPRDKVLARSKHGDETIVVRLLSRTPFLAWPLAVFDHERSHRCEYNRGSRLWSCVTDHQGDSDEAHSAAVEWDWSGTTATVSIDGSPRFICHFGRWSDFKPQ